jgi:type II secretory pathway pseudopilin PulG
MTLKRRSPTVYENIKDQSSNFPELLTPGSLLRTSKGFTYIALLAAIVIIGITLGSATKYWSSVSMRDKEEELLFRGEQYRLAIERYYTAIPGRNQYPQSIDDLLKDSRTLEGKRYLRQKYKDPITGEDFVEDRDQLSRRIIGVHSSSDKEPIKQANFPETSLIYTDFVGKKKYSEWKFQFMPQGQAPGVPASTVVYPQR